MKRATHRGPQSVGRVFAILEALAGGVRGASLSELAAQAGAPKTSLVGLLAGLLAEGCVTRDDKGRYLLGPRFVALATRVVSGSELSVLARPILTNLVEETGETAVLGVVAPDAEVALYLDRVESTNPIRYAVTVGERRELYCTAIGKTLLAQFDAARLKAYLAATPRQRFTPNTITGARELLAEAARIRREGIARTSDERVSGASGLGAPISAADGTVIAALAIAGPSRRMQANAKKNEQLLRRAAARCTELVGGNPAAGVKQR